jgi:hypothetical protein
MHLLPIYYKSKMSAEGDHHCVCQKLVLHNEFVVIIIVVGKSCTCRMQHVSFDVQLLLLLFLVVVAQCNMCGFYVKLLLFLVVVAQCNMCWFYVQLLLLLVVP